MTSLTRLTRFLKRTGKHPPGEMPYRPLEAGRALKTLMQRYYLLTRVGPRLGMKTAWLTSGAPVELPLSLGIIPQYPENFGALCGARKVAVELCQAAEAHGYSPDLCSYARNDLGSLLAPNKAPLGGLSRPDMLIACNNICGTVTKWWEHLAHRLGVPLFLLDTPFVSGQRPPHLIDYAERQVGALIAFLEEHTGRKLDMGRLRETVALSDRLSAIFEEIMELRKAVPSPMGGEDMNSIMFFLVTMSGTESAVKVFQTAAQEVRDRVEEGRGVLANERHRIIFEGIPPWFNMGLFNYLHEFDAITVDEFYPKLWYGRLDPDYPLESLAKKYIGVFGNSLSYQAVRENLEPRVKDYNADGVILWNLTTCRVASAILAPRIGEVYKEDLGIPVLVVDADQIDPRVYNEVEVKEKIETFLEMLGENGSSRGNIRSGKGGEETMGS